MNPALAHQSEWLQCRVEGDLAIFSFGKKILEISTDLDKKNFFFHLLSEVESDPSIKTLLFLNQPGALSDESYDTFLAMLDSKRDSLEAGILVSREELAINQLIIHISTSKKITVFGLQDEIATPFIGIALACDFRLAAEEALLDLSHVKKGVPPSGGLGFFLPRYIGQARSTFFILTGRIIPATIARQMGMVNALIPSLDFEKQAIEKTAEFTQIPADSLPFTKALIHPYQDAELKEYLDREYATMLRACEHIKLQPLRA